MRGKKRWMGSTDGVMLFFRRYHLNLREPFHLISSAWNVLNLLKENFTELRTKPPFSVMPTNSCSSVKLVRKLEGREAGLWHRGECGPWEWSTTEKHQAEQGIASGKIQEILPAVSREKGLFQDQKKAIISIFFLVKKQNQPNSTIAYLPFSSKYNLSWRYKQKKGWFWTAYITFLFPS